MTTRGEYTTVADVLATYLANTSTTDNALMLDLIRAASRDIDELGQQAYFPLIATRSYDVPGAWPQDRTWGIQSRSASRAPLVFDAPLAEVTTLTNGDDTTISASAYLLEPYNDYPKNQLRLKPTSTVQWLFDSAGEALKVIDVLGVWTGHPNYANAWVDSATTASAIASTSATSFTSSSGAALKAGWLIKIDSEYLYVSAISSNTVTVVRGVNGSTAATHLNGAAVYYWEVPASVELLCRQAAAAYYKLRANPVGETVNLDGGVFTTPKDVRKYIETSLERLSFSRVVFG